MRRLRLQSIAEAEVAEALEWYRQRSATAAQDFVAAVDQTLRRIEQDPESPPLVSKTSGGPCCLASPTPSTTGCSQTSSPSSASSTGGGIPAAGVAGAEA